MANFKSSFILYCSIFFCLWVTIGKQLYTMLGFLYILLSTQIKGIEIEVMDSGGVLINNKAQSKHY